MACGITRPSPQTLFDRCKAMFSVEVLGGSDIVPESNEWYVTALNFAMMDELWSVMDQQWKERDPRYACCDNLVQMAELDGVFPSPGKAAEGYAEITGTAGARLPSTFQIIVGYDTYSTSGSVPLKMPASGSVTVRVKSSTIGSSGNSSCGADLSGVISSQIPGVDTAVTIKGGSFCGGTDPETCEQFRTRYIARLAYTPRSRSKDIEQIILNWPCVTRVCKRAGSCCKVDEECGDRHGCQNAVHYYALFDDTFTGGLAPQCVIDDMNLVLFGETPGHGEGEFDIGICGAIHTATAVSVTVTISGLGCLSSSDRQEVKSRIEGFFKILCPSSTISRGALDAVIYQVAGASAEFSAEMTVATGDEDNVDINPCGDIDLHCDYAAVLASVEFSDTTGGTC